jgi:hypothetical protein
MQLAGITEDMSSVLAPLALRPRLSAGLPNIRFDNALIMY